MGNLTLLTDAILDTALEALAEKRLRIVDYPHQDDELKLAELTPVESAIVVLRAIREGG